MDLMSFVNYVLMGLGTGSGFLIAKACSPSKLAQLSGLLIGLVVGHLLFWLLLFYLDRWDNTHGQKGQTKRELDDTCSVVDSQQRHGRSMTTDD